MRANNQDPLPRPDEGSPLLATPKQVAQLLQVSTRTLWRMRSAGNMPTPVRLGTAVRWRLDEIEAWIAQGCPSDDQRDNNHRRN